MLVTIFTKNKANRPFQEISLCLKLVIHFHHIDVIYCSWHFQLFQEISQFVDQLFIRMMNFRTTLNIVILITKGNTWVVTFRQISYVIFRLKKCILQTVQIKIKITQSQQELNRVLNRKQLHT